MTAPIRQQGLVDRADCLGFSFSKIIALQYYDGPTAGVAQCSECEHDYKFDMLDQDLDPESGEDVRVFWLASLPMGALHRILVVCPDADGARWPIWVPRWQFGSQAERQAADEAVNSVLSEAGPPDFVVASSDGLRTLIECKPVSRQNTRNVRDWFRYLSLAKRESVDGA